MTTPTDIDRDAPVIAHHEIDIGAPLETVWRLQTNVNGWPVWQTDITGMQSALDKSLTDWLGHLKAAAESTS